MKTTKPKKVVRPTLVRHVSVRRSKESHLILGYSREIENMMIPIPTRHKPTIMGWHSGSPPLIGAVNPSTHDDIMNARERIVSRHR